MHYPVMLSNTLTHIQSLKILRKAKLLDCNFGLGGHSNAILNKFHNIFMYVLCIIFSTAYDLDSSILERYRNNRDLQKGDQSRLRIVN